ncbi:cupin domain-containing protein [Planomicrobium sp. YIM 101495]|uniref:cupin domain-containing protein n=1 Tax=Planomicrobium sp. YIM 101495 TaxID=2665160 RepID=UPI0012B94EB7|nr:cupin domain-containing protein [Planomicrobium sp. YIM 101495]MTD30523.1 cupin domain-containing protein [Planomicrobium sp. YIM 101495]
MEKIRPMTFTDDGHIPNNPDLPVILYPACFAEHPEEIEKTFNMNGWTNSWQGDVFTYHHYHSNTHEVLGVRSGEATIQLGGENGETLTVKTGDVALLPAGTGHKKLNSSEDFQIVGAYPGGLSPNIKTGKDGERPFVLEEIADVPKPLTDPVQGDAGPVHAKWKT